MAAPRSADDDEFRVSERDDGGDDSADGLAKGLTRGRRLRAGPAAVTRSRSTSMAVESACLRPSSPNTSMKRTARPFGPAVTRCAISPARPPCPPLTSPSLMIAQPSPSPRKR